MYAEEPKVTDYFFEVIKHIQETFKNYVAKFEVAHL